jgi:glycoprotein endo-alpha-1,2-mannosidase
MQLPSPVATCTLGLPAAELTKIIWLSAMRPLLLLVFLLFLDSVLIGSCERSVHAFYYLWYGNLTSDGRWKHWDHKVLPHWQPNKNAKYPQIGQEHHPPESIHSSFYPVRGTYSSRDPSTLSSHFREMRAAGISVAVVSWWGQKSRSESHDSQGVSTDSLIPAVLAAAATIDGLTIAFHMEPYPGRTAESTYEDLLYIHDTYGSSKALYRIKNKLVFYIYDSYHIHHTDWAQYFTSRGLPFPLRLPSPPSVPVPSLLLSLSLGHR